MKQARLASRHMRSVFDPQHRTGSALTPYWTHRIKILLSDNSSLCWASMPGSMHTTSSIRTGKPNTLVLSGTSSIGKQPRSASVSIVPLEGDNRNTPNASTERSTSCVILLYISIVLNRYIDFSTFRPSSCYPSWISCLPTPIVLPNFDSPPAHHVEHPQRSPGASRKMLGKQIPSTCQESSQSSKS